MVGRSARDGSAGVDVLRRDGGTMSWGSEGESLEGGGGDINEKYHGLCK